MDLWYQFQIRLETGINLNPIHNFSYGFSTQSKYTLPSLSLLERENITEEVDMDCRGVIEVIAEEVDDEKAKETAAENSSSSRKQVGRSTGPVDCPQ